jgi:hypothetical protein
MKVLLVGADRLGNIPSKLKNIGVREIVHWTGRSKSFWTKVVPRSTEKVIIFCDFIDHNTMSNVKHQAKFTGIPVVYCKRAISQEEFQI